MPVTRYSASITIVYIVAASVVLIEAVLWLADPTPRWSLNAPPATVWGIGAFAAVMIVMLIWQLLHLATSMRLGVDTIDIDIAFVSHRTVNRRDVLSVRCHQARFNEPGLHVVHAGGYFDVFLPEEKDRDDLARHLTGRRPPS